MKISVVVAAYNGEKYLKEQLDSIISELEKGDELIVSLDRSTDNSRAVLKQWLNDKYDEIVEKELIVFAGYGPGKGALANFESALSKASGDVIFLADQDDVWVSGKRSQVIRWFTDKKVMVVLHDAYICDENLDVMLPSFFSLRQVRRGVLSNLIKNSYLGCCMAIRRDVVRASLPFPKDLPMHDQWLGILGESMGRVIILKKPLLYYRRHPGTVTDFNHSNTLQMVKWRVNITYNFLTRRTLIRKMRNE